MATMSVLRVAARTRWTPSVAIAARTYVTTVRSTRVSATPVRTSTSATTPARKTNIADEVEIPPEVFSVPPESVPSSSTLRSEPPSQPPTSFAEGQFADPSSIGGSPADPSTPDWSRSYFGLSTQPFPKEVSDILLAPVDPLDVEMKPGT